MFTGVYFIDTEHCIYCLFYTMNSHTKNETSSTTCQSVLSETDNIKCVNLPSTCEKEPQPRRSFSKRKSIALEFLANGINTENEKNNQCKLEKVQENVATEEQLKKFKSEIEAWRDMCKERKQKYIEMVEKSSVTSQLKLDLNADFLRDEDKELIKNHPNYEEILSKLKKVSEMTAICMRMREKSAQMSHKVMELTECRETAIKKKIIEHFESLYSSD